MPAIRAIDHYVDMQNRIVWCNKVRNSLGACSRIRLTERCSQRRISRPTTWSDQMSVFTNMFGSCNRFSCHLLRVSNVPTRSLRVRGNNGEALQRGSRTLGNAFGTMTQHRQLRYIKHAHSFSSLAYAINSYDRMSRESTNIGRGSQIKMRCGKNRLLRLNMWVKQI